MQENLWTVPKEKLLSSLESRENGLTNHEVKNRQEKYGMNIVPEKDKREWLDILVSQFISPLLLILIFALIIAAYLGDMFDTIIILAIVIISAVLGFIQEYKSEKVLEELKKYVSYHVTVIRNGERVRIDSRELVPGDIVTVGIGDIVPADIRIIETTGIAVDEGILTGESREVEKNILVPSSTNIPQEITNGIFMGTTVLDGYAKGIVISTGENTFFGKTAAVFSSKVPESDFQLGIRKFGDVLIRIILIISVVIFLSNYLMEHGENPLVDSALFALAIAIGIAPEALPVVITITLSSGSLALAKKKVVTKKLAAIEDLGNMDVLCTDKTGTLTDEIRVERYVDLDKKDSHDVLEYAALCNSAVGTVKIRGNAIDVAIRKHARHLCAHLPRFKKIQEIPFDFNRKRMGQVIREGKKYYLIVKGAPENVMERCTKVEMDGKLWNVSKKSKELKKMIEEYHSQGYSSIAVAYREIESKKNYSKEDEEELVFIGFVLLKSHPKASVRSTLERLKKLNVSLKIISGDDSLVTKKLCKDIGFGISENRIILGSEIKEMDEKELSKIVEKYNVFARVTPEQKLKIIEKLRENGHVVGFLGDGINDAPSLRTADVGISVESAADVAKGASHIILLEKSLGVICDGIEGGRKTFGNITKYIQNTMSANQGNMITLALSSFFLPFIPLLPGQILLNNLLSDIPLMGISTDRVDDQYTKKPQKWDIKMLVKFMIFFGVISTIFDLLFIGIVYFFMHVDVDTFRTAWFLESVLSEMLIVFSLRTQFVFFRNLPSKILFLASIGAGALSVFVIYFEPIASMFHLVPLGVPMLLFTAGTLIAYFAVTEIGKVIFYKRIHPMD